MYAENVQRTAAHRFQKVHNGAMAAAEPHEQPDEKQACSTIQKDAQRPQRPLGQRDAVGGAGSKSAYGNECCGGQQPGKDLGRQGLVQQMLLFGKEADIEVGHHHGTLDQAEGQLPHKARAPAQQDAACHSPWNIALREDVQDHIQQHPAYHQRQQIPHRPAGEELLPEILGRVGQAQQKAAGDLDRLADGAG